jgi:hypothetical protein
MAVNLHYLPCITLYVYVSQSVLKAKGLDPQKFRSSIYKQISKKPKWIVKQRTIMYLLYFIIGTMPRSTENVYNLQVFETSACFSWSSMMAEFCLLDIVSRL